MDLQLFRHEILRYSGTPNQHRQTNRLYRRMRIGAAQRELFRSNGECFLVSGHGCVPYAEGSADTCSGPRGFPTEPTFGTRVTTVCGDLGWSARARLRMGYILSLIHI